jgi:S1-C subfamily serine protease
MGKINLSYRRRWSFGARFLMRLYTVILSILFCVLAGKAGIADDSTSKQGSSDSVQTSVVKVFSTVRLPDTFKPWGKQEPQEISGSGIIIEGHRILTNAHVVLYANQIQVQANQSGDKVSATVVAIAPGIDLALLKLDDESLFSTHPPLARAGVLPDVKDAVMTYGFPTGGTNLSITKGIVSRIEFAHYTYPVSGLRIQIDAAINPGNSGGPAVVDNKMIGVAFSRLGGNTENIGYIIPCEEVDLFLKDIADGHYDGKPLMAEELQTFENPALRPFLKLDNSVTGIIVRQPASAEASYPLKAWDIITKIGDTNIDDEGMVNIGNNLRVKFQYLVQKIAVEGKVPLSIVRGGKMSKVELPVTSDRPLLIPDLQGSYPAYFIYGPLVFSVASSQFIANLGRKGNSLLGLHTFMGSPLAARLGEKPAFPGEELVVVSSPFFPHALSKGYGNPIAYVVKTVNGISIRNLNHLVQVLRDSRDEFDVITYWGRGGESMVFPRKKMRDTTDEILTDNGIRSQGSQQALEVWGGGRGR